MVNMWVFFGELISASYNLQELIASRWNTELIDEIVLTKYQYNVKLMLL